MFKITKKFTLNFRILRLFLVPTILVSTSFINITQVAKANYEFQWDQNSGYRRLKWFQKENKRRFRNTIYFFLRPFDRDAELLKINLAIPKTFKATLKKEKLTTRDSRAVERKKYGHRKARRSFQFSKR